VSQPSDKSMEQARALWAKWSDPSRFQTKEMLIEEFAEALDTARREALEEADQGQPKGIDPVWDAEKQEFVYGHEAVDYRINHPSRYGD
jgi:hypothetical protein